MPKPKSKKTKSSKTIKLPNTYDSMAAEKFFHAIEKTPSIAVVDGSDVESFTTLSLQSLVAAARYKDLVFHLSPSLEQALGTLALSQHFSKHEAGYDPSTDR